MCIEIIEPVSYNNQLDLKVREPVYCHAVVIIVATEASIQACSLVKRAPPCTLCRVDCEKIIHQNYYFMNKIR